ncbi:MAG: LysM peptidoglycan-binding domain-containing protein [Jatrophihabitantaceae bacterium]
MSVATEFPPVVHIPDRARQSMPGGRVGAVQRHLAVVPATEPAALVGPAITTLRQPVAGGRFGESTVSWPLSVAPAASAPLRLTRRGVVALALLTVVLGALLLVVARASFGGAPATPASGSAAAGPVTVQPGDTLWTIAQQVAPNRDPRLEVDRLRELNHLASVALSPGQTLKVG